MTFLQLFVASDHLHRSGIALSGVQGSGAGDPLTKRPGAQQRTKSSKADPRLGRPGWSRGRSYPLCLINVHYRIDSKLLFNATRKTIAECIRLSLTCQQVGWRQCRNNVNVVLYSSI